MVAPNTLAGKQIFFHSCKIWCQTNAYILINDHRCIATTQIATSKYPMLAKSGHQNKKWVDWSPNHIQGWSWIAQSIRETIAMTDHSDTSFSNPNVQEPPEHGSASSLSSNDQELPENLCDTTQMDEHGDISFQNSIMIKNHQRITMALKQWLIMVVQVPQTQMILLHP